jgi:hypothetical protein
MLVEKRDPLGGLREPNPVTGHRVPGANLGCPSKLVSIRNNRNWNQNYFRHYPKQKVCFGCFGSTYTKKESFGVSIEPKQTEDQPKQFDRGHILVFFVNLGLFRFVSKQLCLFQLFRYRFETPKQTETQPK